MILVFKDQVFLAGHGRARVEVNEQTSEVKVSRLISLNDNESMCDGEFVIKLCDRYEAFFIADSIVGAINSNYCLQIVRKNREGRWGTEELVQDIYSI